MYGKSSGLKSLLHADESQLKSRAIIFAVYAQVRIETSDDCL